MPATLKLESSCLLRPPLRPLPATPLLLLQAGDAGGPWSQDHTLVWLPLRTWATSGPPVLFEFAGMQRISSSPIVLSLGLQPDSKTTPEILFIFYFILGNYFIHLFMLELSRAAERAEPRYRSCRLKASRSE